MTKMKPMIISLLRAIALVACVVATIVMSTAHDSTQVFGLKFDAKFSQSPSFKYFVIVYAIVSCYSLAILLIPFKTLLWRLVLVLDMVMTMMLTSSFSAAMAIAYVGKKGNSHAGWAPICGQVPKFCQETTAALATAFLAAFLYFLLLIFSLYLALTPFFSLQT